MGSGGYHGGSTVLGPGSDWFSYKGPGPRKKKRRIKGDKPGPAGAKSICDFGPKLSRGAKRRLARENAAREYEALDERAKVKLTVHRALKAVAADQAMGLPERTRRERMLRLLDSDTDRGLELSIMLLNLFGFDHKKQSD